MIVIDNDPRKFSEDFRKISDLIKHNISIQFFVSSYEDELYVKGEKLVQPDEITDDINNFLEEKYPRMKNFPALFNLFYVCSLIYDNLLDEMSELFNQIFEAIDKIKDGNENTQTYIN